MSLRTPTARVRGLGSAKHGVDHWWSQRLTAIALVPLVTWFLASMVAMVGADHATFADWFGTPGRAVAALALVFALFYHLRLGLQVVIEDYVHARGWTAALLIANTFACTLLGIACAFSVIRLALGG
jgi:succinate dehydrogenase / fumarate reductase membrane anchor subunit